MFAKVKFRARYTLCQNFNVLSPPEEAMTGNFIARGCVIAKEIFALKSKQKQPTHFHKVYLVRNFTFALLVDQIGDTFY